jgi:DmsE family decaheme c-type cytochrome
MSLWHCRAETRHGGLVSLALGALLALVFTLPPAASAQAPPPSSALPPGYAGADTCKGCHEDQWNVFARTKMGRLFTMGPRNQQEALVCETCHGPGKAHADAGGGKGVGGLITFAKNDKTPVEKRNEVCLTCHLKGDRLFWKGSLHEGRSLACTSCHKIMEDLSPKAQLVKPTVIDTCGNCHIQKRAQQMRYSHMPLREGKMTCTSCHNPHGSLAPTLLRDNSTNENCLTCHAEKRGPFLWEHAPVIESCYNCHDPHGTNHEKMLKVPKPQLCRQCHNETRHPATPHGRELGSVKYIQNRSCTNCHVAIHGSNHPSGNKFVR